VIYTVIQKRLVVTVVRIGHRREVYLASYSGSRALIQNDLEQIAYR
jgi:hypothetical protein